MRPALERAEQQALPLAAMHLRARQGLRCLLVWRASGLMPDTHQGQGWEGGGGGGAKWG